MELITRDEIVVKGRISSFYEAARLYTVWSEWRASGVTNPKSVFYGKPAKLLSLIVPLYGPARFSI